MPDGCHAKMLIERQLIFIKMALPVTTGFSSQGGLKHSTVSLTFWLLQGSSSSNSSSSFLKNGQYIAFLPVNSNDKRYLSLNPFPQFDEQGDHSLQGFSGQFSLS